MRGTQSGGRAAALAAALGLGSAEPGAASPLAARPPLPWPPLAPRPNLAGADVVLITIDALRADRLGAFGSLQKLTPHLDQLAAQSVVFSRTYSPSPTSSYSLASLFCSRYALGRAHSQPGPWMTLAEHLSRFGYRTYATYNEGIFFTDAETFSHYQTTGFGFQHRRVAYLDAYDISRGGAASLLDGPGPAFVWLHVAEPHEPYQVRPGFHRGDSPQNRYDAEVAYADRHLEQILAPLRQRKAIVIVTADHGEAFGEHGAYYHTSDVYAEQSWVPLLVFYPGITPRRIDAPATLIDLAPTLLELLGLPALPGAEGRSFAPLLAGQNPDNGPVFSEWRELRAVARGSSRMRCDLRMDTCELFDIQNDPLEQRDLSRRRPEEFRELRAILRAFVMQQATAESQPATSPLVELAAGDLSALPGARAALADPDPETRAKAAALLGEHPDPASMPALLPLLDDPAREVQAEAAISLGRLGELSAAPILRRLLGTEDSNLAARAALALAALGDAGPLEISQGLLGSDEALQREALDMLSAQGEIARRDPVVLDRISALLGGPLTAEAAQVLAALGASESAPTLAEALRQATQIPARSALVQALGVLKNPVAIPALLERAAFGEGGDEVGEALLAVGATAPKDGAGGAAELAAKGRGWRCSPGGCAPLSSEETLSLRAPKTLAPRPYALLLSARGEGTLSVWLGNKLLGETTLLDEPRDLRFLLPAEALRAGRPLPLRLAIQGKLILRLAMVLPVPDDPSTRYTE
jgi:arylsulfatase A-like enzyme